MRNMILAFWLGAAVAFVVFVMTTAATTFEASVTGSPSQPPQFVQYVDQGALGHLLAPAAFTFGTVRLTKRGWGFVTTYTEDLTIAAGLLTRAGAPVDFQVRLSVPGRVVATNATGRDGNGLAWSTLPANGPLRAETRAVNWPLLVFLGVALAASIRLRGS